MERARALLGLAANGAPRAPREPDSEDEEINNNAQDDSSTEE